MMNLIVFLIIVLIYTVIFPAVGYNPSVITAILLGIAIGTVMAVIDR